MAEQDATHDLIIPIEQALVDFHGKPILAVRLPDGRPGVAVRSLCENMGLDRVGQIQRIQRTKPIAGDLIPNVQIETEGGSQRTHVLTLRALAYWLATIDTSRAREDIRDDILRYQVECVDKLYEWAQGSRALAAPSAQTVVPADATPRPAQPAHNASLDEWRSYHLRMAAFIDWQMEMQVWQGTIAAQLEGVEARLDEHEARLESAEAVSSLIVEVLERLPPETITNQHQRFVQAYVRKLAEASGKHPNTIHDDLKTVFEVPRYQELLEADWEKIAQWFETQIEQAQKKKKK